MSIPSGTLVVPEYFPVHPPWQCLATIGAELSPALKPLPLLYIRAIVKNINRENLCQIIVYLRLKICSNDRESDSLRPSLAQMSVLKSSEAPFTDLFIVY